MPQLRLKFTPQTKTMIIDDHQWLEFVPQTKMMITNATIKTQIHSEN